MTPQERKVMKLALEALENSVDLVVDDAYNAEQLYGNYPTRQGKVGGLKVLAEQHKQAITAIKEALAQPAPVQKSCYCLNCEALSKELTELKAQPEQEPASVTYKEVADTMNLLWHGSMEAKQYAEVLENKKLYTSPQQEQRKPLTLWSEAQHERAYRNSPELHKDVKSLSSFKRVAKAIAAMYDIKE